MHFFKVFSEVIAENNNHRRDGSDPHQVILQFASLRRSYSDASKQFKFLSVFIPNLINLLENIILFAGTLIAYLFALPGYILNNDDEHGLCVNDYMLRCLSGQLYAMGANIANIVLSIIAPISRNMITAIYGYDKSENNQLKDKKILTATSNTFGSPVEKFLSFSVDRLFKLADEASEDVNPMSFFEEGLTV